MAAPDQPITLHWHPLSGHAHRVALFCALAGLPCRLAEVDLGAGAHKRPEFLEKNVFGQIPVLEDGDVMIADSAAILLYLARRYAPEWAPQDAREEAEIQRWFSVAAGPLRYGPALARVARVFGREIDFAAAEAIAAGLFQTLETHLSERDFLLGAKPSLADVALYSYTAHAPEGGIALAPYPAIERWLARIEALPGFLPMRQTAVGLRAEAFHGGEKAVQARLGAAEAAARLGPRMIRDQIPPDRAAFLAELSFLPIAAMDGDGEIRPSMAFGAPGFVSALSPRRLRLRGGVDPRDPIQGALTPGAAFGALAIDLAARRRVRINGVVEAAEAGEVILKVRQTYGNCSKYIQPRRPSPAPWAEAPPPAIESAGLSPRGREILEAAETFFLATGVPGPMAAGGADVSHRGGPAGFIQVAPDGAVAFPDYPGNRMFNSLGNLALNPRAGICALDFASGDLLLLRGQARILWGEAGAKTAQGVRFEVAAETLLPQAAPLRFA